MVEQLCQTYHWTIADAMKLTVPQIVMLGHASWVNYKRSGLDKDKDDKPSDVTVNVNGKSKNLSDMNSEEYMRYYSDWG